MSRNFPNRDCSHGTRRLHRTSSLRHESSASSTQMSHTYDPTFDPLQSSSSTVQQLSVAKSADYGAHTFFGMNAELYDGLSSSTPCPDTSSAPPAAVSMSDGYSIAPTVPSAIPQDTLIEELNERENDRALERTATESSRPTRIINALNEKLATANIIINYLKNQLEARPAAHDAQSEANKGRELPNEPHQNHASERYTVSALLAVSLLLLAYAYLCWLNGPEMSYIRQRRRDVLGV